MKREDLIKSPHYWLAHIQSDLYEMMEDYRKKNDLKKKDMADILGVTKGYISQILNGDFDHKLSKLIELSLAFGKIPKLEFVDIDQYLKNGRKCGESSVNKKVELKIVYNASDPTEKIVSDGNGVLFNNEALVNVPGALSKELGYYKIQSIN